MKNISWRKIGSVLLALYALWVVAHVWGHKDLQWDFQEYYHSAQAHAQGVNPYGIGIATTQGAFPHVYPPLSLWLFRPFAPMSYNAAFDVYLFLKCLTLIGLIGLWRNAFLNRKAEFFFLFCLIAFNSAIGLDLRAGNVCGFEQLLIWLAFFFFIKKRYKLFCGMLVLAATFKLQPFLFLFLILLTEEKRKFSHLFWSLTLLGAASSILFFTDPVLFKDGALGDYFKNLSYMTGERGIFHPSTFALARDLVSLFCGGFFSPALVKSISWGIYAVVFSAVLLLSWKAYAQIHAAGGEERDKRVVFLACFVYALSAFRFKDYSFILLILPSYFVIRNSCISSKGLLLFLAGLAAISFPLPGSRIVFTLLFEYYPLFFAFLMWGLYLHEIHLLSAGNTSKPGAIPAP